MNGTSYIELTELLPALAVFSFEKNFIGTICGLEWS